MLKNAGDCPIITHQLINRKQSIYPSCLSDRTPTPLVRVQELSEELLQRRRQDEKEAEDLESMVHSVEQNLHLMTVC